MEKVKPSIKVSEVGKDYFYVSDSPVSEIISNFKHHTDIPILVELLDRIKKLELQREQDNHIVGSTLKALGVEQDPNYTNTYLLCQTLLNAKIVLNGQTAFGYEIDSMTGYMKSVIKLDGLLAEMPEHPTFMHKVDDKWVFDEAKFNEMMSAV